MPIKCLSVHTATIQNIHSFSLLHCTDTVYTQWSIKNILFILSLLRPGGCACILREPFKLPEIFYTYTVKATAACFIFYLTSIQLSEDLTTKKAISDEGTQKSFKIGQLYFSSFRLLSLFDSL